MTPHPDPAVLDALVAKLEAAGEGSRELDLEIATAVFDLEWLPYRPGARIKWGYKRGADEIKFYGPDGVPPYTTSLDAALTLVPAGWYVERLGVELVNPQAWACEVVALDIEAARAADHAAPTPALALCIAALKAQAALTPNPS